MRHEMLWNGGFSSRNIKSQSSIFLLWCLFLCVFSDLVGNFCGGPFTHFQCRGRLLSGLSFSLFRSRFLLFTLNPILLGSGYSRYIVDSRTFPEFWASPCFAVFSRCSWGKIHLKIFFCLVSLTDERGEGETLCHDESLLLIRLVKQIAWIPTLVLKNLRYTHVPFARKVHLLLSSLRSGSLEAPDLV